MRLAGLPAMDVLADIGGKVAAVIAIGRARCGEGFRLPTLIQPGWCGRSLL